MEPISVGEARVRVDFNVTENDVVTKIKLAAADLINLIDSIESAGNVRRDPNDAGRLKALAMTSVEEAAMWAVKAETSPRE